MLGSVWCHWAGNDPYLSSLIRNMTGNLGLFGARMRQFHAIFACEIAICGSLKPRKALFAGLFWWLFQFLAILPQFWQLKPGFCPAYNARRRLGVYIFNVAVHPALRMGLKLTNWGQSRQFARFVFSYRAGCSIFLEVYSNSHRLKHIEAMNVGC